MYFIRPSYCPYCSKFAESHYYDNDEPITDINGNPGLFTYRGPALIQELQVVIQYCDDCAKGPDATRYLKLGIPMDKFLEYCTDEEYARRLKKIIAQLLDRSRRKGEKGKIIHRAQIERDNQQFLQTMVTLQADGKRLLRGEDLGRRKRKEETAKRLHRWLSGIGRGRQQHPGQMPDTAPSASNDAGRHTQVDEKSFWVGVPDREGDEDENDAHESVPHEEAPHEEDPHDNHAHENDNHAHGNGHHTHGSNNHAHETDGHGDEAHKGEPHEGEAHHDQPHADDTHADEPREDEPDKDDTDDAVTTKMSSLEFGH